MDLPKLSQKVELTVLYGPYAGVYSTYSEGVDDFGIMVGHPTVGGTLIPLVQGDPVRLEYPVKGLARVVFPTRVRSLENHGSPCIKLAHPEHGTVERFQQRDFVRLEANLALTYSVLSSPDESEVIRKDVKHATISRDISGSGAQIMCPVIYLAGTQLDIELSVAANSIHVVGEVIRQTQRVSSKEHWTAVRFLSLSERDRDSIIRYIFNEQLARRRRGLL